ncbi:AlbA family DNA-binding domain-containing protein [Nocardia stercoris]|uniref:AlbA family DNA-binding domain-containing protein n=1 Tax=Nocardia stercoris TaxID=2483361 RepID=UPI0011C414EC|nr:RNA-binding domain-containing protein [Nocardia stercoris]
MIKVQIEARVIDIVNHVVAGEGKVEDDYVEAKAMWLPPDKVARKIAAMANAARGEPVIWIVGLDEERHRVVQVDETDPADWWAAVQRGFAHEVSPDLITINVATDHGRVVCLYFETDRAPYLVKTGSTGTATTEIPWRSGTRTRTATRSELLSLLRTSTSIPRLELIRPSAMCFIQEAVQLSGEKKAVCSFSFKCLMFFDTDMNGSLLLPRHRWSCSLRASSGPEFNIEPKIADFSKSGRIGEFGVTARKSGLLVTGPDVVEFNGGVNISDVEFEAVSLSDWVEINIELPTSDSVRSAKIRERLTDRGSGHMATHGSGFRVSWGDHSNYRWPEGLSLID